MQFWIASLLLAFSATSWAQGWKDLGRSEAVGAVIYVDESSLVASGKRVTGTILVDLDMSVPLASDRTTRFRSAVMSIVADCAANTIGVIDETDFDRLHGKGIAVFMQPASIDRRMIARSSYPLGDIFAQYACGRLAQPNGSGMPDKVAVRTGGSRTAWSGGVPNIPEEEWAAYENSQAATCGTDIGRCREARDNFLYSHWPAPRAKPEELMQPCQNNDDFWEDDANRRYATTGDNQERGGALFVHWLSSWAGEFYPNRAYDQRGAMDWWCSDAHFQVIQWQRATGYNETGKLGKYDVDDFVTRWAPIILRLDSISKQLKVNLDTAPPRNKAQAIVERRRQADLDQEAMYANGPAIFDVHLGSRVRELTDCGNHVPGRDFNPMYIKAPTTCYERYDKTLRFPKDVQPNWIEGPVGFGLDGEFIITMRFTANDAGRAVQVIDSRFGAHKVSEVAMHEDGKALCDQAQNCRTLSTPRNWVRVSYKWDTDKVGVTAWHEKGLNATEVYIQYKVADKVRKARAETEEAIGREEGEKAESKEKKF